LLTDRSNYGPIEVLMFLIIKLAGHETSLEFSDADALRSALARLHAQLETEARPFIVTDLGEKFQFRASSYEGLRIATDPAIEHSALLASELIMSTLGLHAFEFVGAFGGSSPLGSAPSLIPLPNRRVRVWNCSASPPCIAIEQESERWVMCACLDHKRRLS